jgi:hypothetical protein
MTSANQASMDLLQNSQMQQFQHQTGSMDLVQILPLAYVGNITISNIGQMPAFASVNGQTCGDTPAFLN